MTTVAITGINSYFASTVLPKLEADPEITKIIGIDIVPIEISSSKVDFFQADVGSDRIRDILKGVDIVMHFAFIVDEIHNKKKTHSINIEGSKNVFSACALNEVKKIIYTSSIASYGSHPDNPIGISEDFPLRANEDSYYSSDKVAVERFLAAFVQEHPEISVTIFRPPIIVGPSSKFGKMLSAAWERNSTLAIKGSDVPVQFLHESDLGEALYLAVKRDIPGVFNIAPDDSCSTKKMYKIAGIEVIELPVGFLKNLVNVLFALRIATMSQGWISLGEYPVIVSNRKFKQATGWQPRYSTEEAFRDFLSSVR